MKEILIFLKNIIKKYIKEEIIGFVFSVIYTFCLFLSPQISRFLIDDVLISENFGKLYWGIGAFFFICVAQTFSGYIKNYIFFRVSEKITFSLRQKILKGLLYSPLSFIDKTPKGFILSRFFNDSKSISDFITNIFVVIIKNCLLILALTIGMFFLSWKITLSIIISLCLYIGISIFASRKFKEFSKITLANNDMLHKDFSQSIDNSFLTRVFCLQNYYYKKNERNLRNIYTSNLKIGNFSNIINSFSNIAVIFSLSMIYGFGALLAFKNEISIGTVVALGIYFQMLIAPINELIGNNTRFQEIIPVIKRLNEYLHLEREVLHPYKTSCEAITGEETQIIFKNVYFNYCNNDENSIGLKNINLNLTGNGIYGLFGKSGSGKTTILKLIVGLYTPNKGNINVIIRGKVIANTYELRKEISYISQNFELINASISENLKLFSNEITDEEMIDVCKELNLHSKIMSLKNGYNSTIDEKINLSEGEKQRMCIARSILKKSSIYIFDEPSAFLDKNARDKVKKFIEKLAEDNMVVVVSHDKYLLKNSKNITAISEGKIMDNLTYEDLP